MLKKLLFLSILWLVSISVFAAQKNAIFGMGCFWCGQADFDKVPGVVATTVGYDGGESANPTYEQVSAGSTNYVESVQVVYDTNKTSYPQLLDYFWHHIDPTAINAQFCDHGRQYRSAIFYLDPEQKQQALTSLQAIKKQLGHVYTEITPSTHFYPAEDYHQKYYQKNPRRYEFYRWNCGRDAQLKKVWHVK